METKTKQSTRKPGFPHLQVEYNLNLATICESHITLPGHRIRSDKKSYGKRQKEVSSECSISSDPIHSFNLHFLNGNKE